MSERCVCAYLGFVCVKGCSALCWSMTPGLCWGSLGLSFRYSLVHLKNRRKLRRSKKVMKSDKSDEK